MAELKTKPNDASVAHFIKTVDDPVKRQDSLTLLKLYSRITGEQPQMWGTSIIGFGTYHYKSERSRQEGDWPLAAFSPRKQSLTLYIMPGLHDYTELLATLGKHKTSKACLYIHKLADIDMTVLERLIKESFERAKKELTPES